MCSSDLGTVRGKPITVPFMVPVVFDLQQECSNN